MPLACRLCILTKGLKGSEIHKLPETQEELAEHLRTEHGFTMTRPVADERGERFWAGTLGSDAYILGGDDGHSPIPATILEWARWYEKGDRRVKLTELPEGPVVSTVFLGLDHGFGWYVTPILFETMVFQRLVEPIIHTLTKPDGTKIEIPQRSEWFENLTRRYATWDQAEVGHDEVVAEVRAKLGLLRDTFRKK